MKILNQYDNEMQLEFDSKSENESFARTVVAAFASQLNPTLEEIADIKTAVSEAVTNCIIHGYEGREGKIFVHCYISGNEIGIDVKDAGVGIENVKKAMEPLYTTRPDLERSGMGFAFMQTFMDELAVESKVKEGTLIRMKKKIQTT
ncbi:MAG: anti-sigma F factor [Lachnospiraceae bacterium]|nr:anti-sigma F factor [Lachnospiraceae bacterium]